MKRFDFVFYKVQCYSTFYNHDGFLETRPQLCWAQGEIGKSKDITCKQKNKKWNAR